MIARRSHALVRRSAGEPPLRHQRAISHLTGRLVAGRLTGGRVLTGRVTAACAKALCVAGAVLGLGTGPSPAEAAPARPSDETPLVVPTLQTVPGSSRPTGPAPLRRFAIEVEHGLPIDRAAFAAEVQGILFDRRGWTGRGRIALQRVDAGPLSFRVTLATPATTDRLCKPLVTRGRVSCENRGRAVLNAVRWTRGSRAWGSLRAYRRYLVNHEVGHSLGHRHRRCPGPGRRAPVMQQQTGGSSPCLPGLWPLPEERALTPLPPVPVPQPVEAPGAGVPAVE